MEEKNLKDFPILERFFWRHKVHKFQNTQNIKIMKLLPALYRLDIQLSFKATILLRLVDRFLFLFGCVLWHIDPYALFNAKFYYIYIYIYNIYINGPEFNCLHIVKWCLVKYMIVLLMRPWQVILLRVRVNLRVMTIPHLKLQDWSLTIGCSLVSFSV